MQSNLQKKNLTRAISRQQEAFVQALIKGKSQRQAYYEAYPKSRSWKEESVDVKASLLCKNVKVQKRFAELNEKLAQRQESKLIYSATQLRQFWTSILSDEEAGMSNRLKASELLGKSQGMFVEKRETTFTAEDCVIKIKKNEDD